MRRAKIVLSYRRSDARAMAGRIRDRLASRFGGGSVYFDIDNIPYGVDFRTHIASALSDADVLVVIVGPKWQGESSEAAQGQPRIFQETDPVRVEVEAALLQGIAILPVLIDGAAMPQPSALPDSIKSFSFINAAEVDDGRDFHQHMERVERSIDAVFRQKSSRSGSIRLPILATAMVAAVVVGLATWMFAPHLLGSRNPLVETPPAKREAQAPQINTPTVPAPDASAPRRGAALVIGNSNYQRAPKLVTPANDATAMGQQLKAAGYNTITKLDVGNLEFKRALREFDDAAQAADIGIVYFGGHGLSVRGTDYLLPVDARLATEYDVADETIALDRILFAMESLTSLRLLILDASRDNPFARTMKRSSPGTPGLDKTEPASGNTLIAFAAKAGTVAEEGNGPNSVFVTALLKNLFVPGLDIRLALGRVRDDVLRATNNRQEPFVYGSLGGQVVTLVAKN